MIVKVQRELTTGHEDQTVCICNETRTVYLIAPMTPDLLGWFKRGELKFYAHAELIGTVVNLLRKAQAHEW